VRELASVPAQLPRLMEMAMRAALQRGGVGVVVVPGEVFVADAPGKARPARLRAVTPVMRPDEESLAAAAQVLNGAGRVTILAGAGCTAAHWAYGSTAAAMYGVIAGSAPRPRPWYGLPFGATVWASSYVVLPVAGLYQPIWKYDAKTLAWDLSAHLAYGAGTGTTFWLLTKII
jgi:hypothetical protein